MMITDESDAAPSSSSAVRQKALTWHEDVRRVLRSGLRAVAVARGQPPAVGGINLGPNVHPSVEELRVCAAHIVAVVRRQVREEGQELVPVLATLDAWGPLHVDRLRELHDREHAAAAQALAASDDALALASGIEKSVREILRVLRIEERELLDETMLDDTTVVAEKQFGG